jgi:hypothetical protein
MTASVRSPAWKAEGDSVKRVKRTIDDGGLPGRSVGGVRAAARPPVDAPAVFSPFLALTI